MTHQTLLTNLKLVYIMHEVIAKIYEANSIDDKPQYHKTPHKKSYISINHEVKVLDGGSSHVRKRKWQLDTSGLFY